MYAILTVWRDSGAIQQSNNGIVICLQSTLKEIMNLKVTLSLVTRVARVNHMTMILY